jgi:hypothetical protein
VRCVIRMDVFPHRQNVLAHAADTTHILWLIVVSLCVGAHRIVPSSPSTSAVGSDSSSLVISACTLHTHDHLTHPIINHKYKNLHVFQAYHSLRNQVIWKSTDFLRVGLDIILCSCWGFARYHDLQNSTNINIFSLYNIEIFNSIL